MVHTDSVLEDNKFCLFLPEHLSNNAILRERYHFYRLSTPPLQRRNAFNLHIGIQGQRLDGNTSMSSEQLVRKIEIGNETENTYVRHGLTSPQYCTYTEFMSAKLSISDRNTFTLTTLLISDPAASRMLVRFLIHWC